MSTTPANSLASFRWVCAVISPLAQTSPALRQLAAGTPDWEDVMHVASGNLVLPNLVLGLQAHGLLGKVPAEFLETLEGFKSLNTLRNARLRKQMLEISAALNAIGIVPVWLKGANNLIADGWQDSGRMMLDLDFWLPDPKQMVAAQLCLEQLGYLVPDEYISSNFERCQHLAPRFREGELARIEPHKNIVAPAVSALLPDCEARDRVEWLDWEGLRVGRLSMPDRMMHSYIQCTEMSGHSMFLARISLMKVLDFVSLAHVSGEAFHATQFLEKLGQLPWRLRSRQFLSYVAHDFGLMSPLPFDGSYIFRRRLAHAFPRLMRGRLFLHLASRVVLEGRLGSPRSWWPRMARFWLSH